MIALRALRHCCLLLMAIAACEDSVSQRPAPVPPIRDSGTQEGGGGGGGGTTRKEGTLRVATFNVRRYFDTVCQSGNCSGNDFEEAPSGAAFETRTDQLAKGIANLEADVVALEEIETQTCLDALIAKLKDNGTVYPVAVLGETGSPGSVDVAVLARGTLSEVKLHRDTPLTRPDGSSTTFLREFLEVRMTFAASGGAAKTLAFFAAHFRSKVDDDPGRRVAEATGARDIVLKTATELPEALVVFGGDLNDTPGSDALNAIEKDGSLVRLAAELSAAEQATFTFEGTRIPLNHLYAPKATAARYVKGSVAAVRDGTQGLAGSDHAALRADINLTAP